MFKAKFITLLISFLLLFSAGIGALLYYVFPEYYPQWYVLIPVFFLFVEVAVIFTIEAGGRKLEQKKMINLYMTTRVVKMLLAFAFIGIYALVEKTEIKNFALVFVLFYLFSILFETYYFVNVERRIKERHNKI